jgi:hypothetical protein
MPCSASSQASAFARITIAPFDAQQAGQFRKQQAA